MTDEQTMQIRLNRVMRYNRNRIDKALSLFPAQKRPLFHCMPFLLHINHPDFPGFVDNPEQPCGLALYRYDRTIQVSLLQIFPEQSALIAQPKSFWPKHRHIESLSLMGSIGTTAQSAKSDLDYWVCVDGQAINSEQWALLQQKLELIEHWVWDNHQLEVHFFLSDIERVRNNDFGEADGESAGSAQPMFLKNEYYSTHIVIAGKMPFWWLVAADCTDSAYDKAYKALQQGAEPNPNYFMDLGNVDKLNINEIFGASLWQLTKAMDSPFKSVLKMAKLEVYMDNTEQRMPLCNVLKSRVHHGVDFEKDVKSTDPYALMFDTIIQFYSDRNPKFLDLFKACLYIKSDCGLTTEHTGSKNNFKRDVITDYVQLWHWKRAKVANYDAVEHWDFQQVSRLGRIIHSFLIGCYRRLSAKLKGCEQLVSAEDMTVIGRKIESFYRDKPGKIQYLKRAFEKGLMQSQMTITMELDLSFDTRQRWSAFRGRQHYQETLDNNPCLLKQSSDPVDLVLWCIFNRIINPQSTFYLLQSQLTISVEDISELMNEALTDYQAVRVSELSRAQLLAPAQIDFCLLVINFSSHASVHEIETVRVIYLDSWGELFSFDDIAAFEALKPQFADQQQAPVCRLFTPGRNKRKILYPLIEQKTGFEFDKIGADLPQRKIKRKGAGLF